jgi:hypothetical protein
MTVHQLINFLVKVMLIELMAVIGLGVSIAELIGGAKKWRLVLRAGLGTLVLAPTCSMSEWPGHPPLSGPGAR